MLGAVVYGHEQMQAVIEAINQLADEINNPVWDWAPPAKDEVLASRIAQLAESDLNAAFQVKQKQARSEAIDNIWRRVFDEVGVGKEGGPDGNAVKEICFALESKIVRGQILNGEPRIDGRDTRTVRPDPRFVPACCRARMVPAAVYARRDAGAGGCHAGYFARRAAHRCIDGRIHRPLYASLKHASVCDR